MGGSMKRFFSILIVAALVSLVLLAGCTTQSKITYENYLKLQTGMTYQNVVAILGEGKLISSSDVMGYESEMYTWSDSLSPGSGISLIFQNGVLMTKTQIGLK